MKRALAATRAALAWVVLTASLVTAAVTLAPTAEAATTTYTASTSVNVRTGPSTSDTILMQLQKGQSIVAAGAVSGNWLPVTYDNTTAYAWAAYLDKDKTADLVVSGPAGRRTALENVNVRATASLDADITAILDEGTEITVTGYSSGDFAQVTVDDTTAWVYAQFLSTATDTTPVAVASYTTTTKLALRSTSSVAATNLVTIAKGSTVGGTGTHDGTYSQVVYDGQVGWVITGYLDAVSGTPDAYVLPLRKATLYASASTVPIRAKADSTSTKLGTITLGFAVRTTGPTDGLWTEVIWNGSTAWAKTAKLSTSQVVDLGSSSLNKLEPNGKAAVLEVRANFPKITTIYGWRSSSAYSSDHPNGRAIDIMIPSYKSNKALGDSIAQYFIDNGKRLHVTYIMWRQRYYTMDRGSWKKMEDRGSDTQNHMNHVHVSFEPS